MNLTPIQSGTLKTWVNSCLSSGLSDTSQILHKLRDIPVSISFSGTSQPREKVLIQMEKFISGLAVKYNLLKIDSPIQLNNKWNNAVIAAPNAAAKLEVSRDESKFWSFYAILKTVDVDGRDNDQVQIPIYNYGKSIINFEIDGNNIEEVQKG